MVNFFDAMITKQEEYNYQKGGAKKAKSVTRKYTGKDCKCPDNVVRKPFTLTGNTQYVVYKGNVVRPSSIPKAEKSKK
jgi:hypothetical protein